MYASAALYVSSKDAHEVAAALSKQYNVTSVETLQIAGYITDLAIMMQDQGVPMRRRR